MDLKESLVSQILSDQAARIEVEDPECATSSSTREVPVYSHNIATMWTALEEQFGSLLKQGPLCKAQALSCLALMATAHESV